MSELPKLLSNKRKELKLSLREAGDLIGISHSYLSTLEKGFDPRTGTPVSPTPDTLKLISDAYKIDYHILMEAAGYLDPDTPTPADKISEPTLDDEIHQIMRDLGPEITLQFYDLKGMSDDEKENLKIFLQGLKARREQKK